MDGHARTTGRLLQTLTVGGLTYTLRAPPIGTLIADMEQYIVSLRQNPFTLARQACSDLPDDMPPAARESVQTRIWQAAENASFRGGSASAMESAEFENSLRGIAYKFWICIKQDHLAELPTVDAALSLLETYIEEVGPDGLQEVISKTASATGEADAKNSSGPIRKNRTGKNQAKRRSRKSSAGRQSTSSSRPSTTSPPTK